MSATPRRKTSKKAAQETISISEFKQWLSGVEDMQEADWVPDAAQWAKIRAKVELLSEDELEPAVQYAPGLREPVYAVANPGAPIPYVPPPHQDYSSLGRDPVNHGRREYQQPILDDSIMMPSKTPQDSAFDQGMSTHVQDQFS